MDTEKLNKKLAEWAGFTKADIKKHYYFEVGGERVPKWQEPGWEWHIKLPNFTESLDACFKWLVPNFPVGIRLRMLGQLRNGKGYFCSIGGKYFLHHYSEAETPSLAFCLATEKLTDG